MSKDKTKTAPTWSVPHIKHPMYPEYTIRVGEFVHDGILHFFRQVNGKQTSKSLKCRRLDLGSNQNAQKKEAERKACEFIEALANPSSILDVAPDGVSPISENRSKSARIGFTIGALADRYKLDGFQKTTASYKRDAIASIRRIAAFLEPNLLVRDLKPSHVEKYLASRIAKKHAPAGRADLVALGICCGWAVGEGLLDANPMASKRARDAMRIAHTVNQPWITDDEIKKLKAVAPQLPPAFAVLLDVAGDTGRRISAILGLRWNDVYFQPADAWRKCKELDARCDWLVEHFANGGIRWYAGKGINRKRRDHVSPMPLAVKDALMQWKKNTLGIGARFVFVAPADPTRALERHIAKKWLKKAEGFAKLDHQAQSGWHAFRRRWATKRKHFSLKDLAAAGDWKTLEMAAHYQQSDPVSRLAVINMA
jgi:integrase